MPTGSAGPSGIPLATPAAEVYHATAAVAWYTSAAGVANGMPDGPALPVGKPLARLRLRSGAR